jgi:glucose-1-phosphate thymidylyltransferase
MTPDDKNIEKSGPSAYVGVVPAAGSGSRLPDLELSKEMLPVGSSGKPVIGHLLHSLHVAGVKDITVILREHKSDLVDYLAGPDWRHLGLGIRKTAGTSGVPESAALGLRDNQDRNIAFGFPDILFEPGDAFTRLMSKLDSENADVVLGLFPTNKPAKSDMVDTDSAGKVISIDIKPEETPLDLTWIIAVWTPAFTMFLLDLVKHDSNKLNGLLEAASEVHLGQIFQLAIAHDMEVVSVAFDDGCSLDIGTPDDLALAQSWAG